MNTAAISYFSDLFDPIRLIGPIFDKELRVSSRRRRNYVLRCAYIGFISLILLFSWYSTLRIRGSGSAVYQVSRLSLVGRAVVITIVWFQFIATQLMAVVMLSSSMSDEIRTGTLAALMTTPISSFQIVVGKLLSKLLQFVLLLAISLPLLAIIRAFGGVPWDYVVSSVCITLTASIFAGSLSLFHSIIYRHAHRVVISVIILHLIVFGALPGILMSIATAGLFDAKLANALIASGLYLIVIIRLAVLSAGSITGEKEARTWPILLATPLDDKEIVHGKAIAATVGGYLAVKALFGTVLTAFIWLALRFFVAGGATWIPYATSISGSLLLIAIGVIFLRRAIHRVRRNIF